MQDLGSESSARELAALFPEASRALFEKISNAVRLHDYEQVSLQAHALRGVAAQICAYRVRVLAQRLELNAEASHDSVTMLIQQLGAEIANAIDAVEEVTQAR